MLYQRITLNIQNDDTLTDADLEKLEEAIEDAVNDAIQVLHDNLPKLPKGAEWTVF